jgi:DNA-binding MarR family transcriptional regulator
MYIHMPQQRKPHERCICATLRKATRTVTQIYDNALRAAGMRATQFHILAEIRGAGEATITQLTAALILDQTTLTRSLGLLERNGLVMVVPRPDARLKAVKLTKKGDRALAAAQPHWASAQKQVMGVIGEDAWNALGAELDRLAGSSNIDA